MNSHSWVQIDPVHCFSAVGSALPGRAAKPFLQELTLPQKAFAEKLATA